MHPYQIVEEPKTPLPRRHRRRMSSWAVIAIGAAALIVLCAIVAYLVPPSGTGTPAPSTSVSGAAVQAIDSSPHATSAAPGPPVGAHSVTVKGRNNSALQIGAVLNGPFTVAYSFSSWCGIVNFLRDDGSDGAGFMESINDCTTDTNATLTGSTIVHLDNVSMVKVENTQGNWKLVFTPL